MKIRSALFVAFATVSLLSATVVVSRSTTSPDTSSVKPPEKSSNVYKQGVSSEIEDLRFNDSIESSKKTNISRRRLLETKNDDVCQLQKSQIEGMLNEEQRIWLIRDIDIKSLDQDLQKVMECTKPGDLILLNTTKTVQPARKIIVSQNLTISAYSEQHKVRQGNVPVAKKRSRLSCSSNEGLFEIRGGDVLLANLILMYCSLTSNSASMSIVELRTCPLAKPEKPVKLQHVTFMNNTLSDAPAVRAGNSSCFPLEMTDVEFLNNRCNGICFSNLSWSNTIDKLALKNTTSFSGGAVFQVLMYLPPGSSSTISKIKATRNERTIIHSGPASKLKLLESTFEGNSADSIIKLEKTEIAELATCVFSNNSLRPSGGSCIQCNYAVLYLSKCSFENNSGEAGTSCKAIDSNMTVTSCSFRRNIANGDGAGIVLVRGQMKIKDTSFKHNTGKSGNGGAIKIDNGMASISGSNFTDNNATIAGAITVVNGGRLETMNTMFVRNNAFEGGSLYTRHSTLKLSACRVESSVANSSGGGLWCSDSEIIINDTLFIENNAQELQGGGINCVQDSTVKISNTTFQANSADNSGGAMYILASSIDAYNITVTNNSCGQYGGGINLENSGRNIVTESHFTNNTGSFGGGIHIKNAELVISHSTIRNCLAHKKGGGLMANHGTLISISNAKISDNNSTSMSGGAMCVYAKMIVKDTLFQRNSAASRGGGLSAKVCDLEVSRSTFSKNKANDLGGGVHLLEVKSCQISDSIFKGNLVEDKGAAIIVRFSENVTIQHCRFQNNSANHAGALETIRSTIEVKDAFFHKNLAHITGGSISVKDNSTATLINVNVSASMANGGGGILLRDSHIRAINLNLHRCNSTRDGGGIYIVNMSTMICSPCQFIHNRADRFGGAVSIVSTSLRTISTLFDDCLFEDNVAVLGGGMYFEKSPTSNCLRSNNSCNIVALIGTQFNRNRARKAGGALFVSNPAAVRIRCSPTKSDVAKFYAKAALNTTQAVTSPDDLCPRWTQNTAGRFGDLISSPARKLQAFIEDKTTKQLRRVFGFHHVIRDHKSGDDLPEIQVRVVDEFGKGPAFGIEEQPVVAIMSSEDGLFEGTITHRLDKGVADFSHITGIQAPGNRSVTIRFQNAALRSLKFIVEVRQCGLGEALQNSGGSNIIFCASCPQSQYSIDPVVGCQPCPENANCSSKGINPKTGYWHRTPCSLHIKQCLTKEACDYNDREQNLSHWTDKLHNCELSVEDDEQYLQAQCRKGYTGMLCGACEKDHGRSQSFLCEECYGQAGSIIIYILSVFILFSLACFGVASNLLSEGATKRFGNYTLTNTVEESSPSQRRVDIELAHLRSTTEISDRNDNGLAVHSPGIETNDVELAREKLVEIFKISINFLQVVGLAMYVNVEWSETARSFFKATDFAVGSATEEASTAVDCLISPSIRTPRSVVRTFILLSIPFSFILLFVCYWISVAYRSSKTWRYFFRRTALSFFFVAFLTYELITKTVVGVFYCVNVQTSPDDMESLWALDTSVRCYKDSHATLAYAISWPLAISFSIGFPLFVALVLVIKRQSRAESENDIMAETMGFLYNAYHDRFKFWESLILVRKGLLAVVVVFGHSMNGGVQASLAVCVLMGATALHVACRPFKEELDSMNHYELTSLMITQFVFASAHFFDNAEDSTPVNNFLTCCVLISILSLCLVLLLAFLSALIDYLRRSAVKNKRTPASPQ